MAISSHSEAKPAKTDFAPFLLGIPLAAAFLLYFGVRNMSLREDAELASYLIGLGVFISTAVMARAEAKAHDIRTDEAWNFGYTGWFFLVALCWALAYPYYMHRRGNYGLRGHFFWAIALVALFTITFQATVIAIGRMKG